MTDIKSIFYARFHDEHGPKVLHQVPEGSIIPCPPSPTAIKEPFFDFHAVSSYLIPYREFCNRPLSICSNGYRILGHPICITDPAKYERNDFIFNFCVVLDEKADWTPFKGVITKLAKLFANLEEQNSFLSKEEEDATIIMAGTEGYGGEKGSKVFAVVEIVFEDLQAVGETMIPIDESNTLSLSLFPTRAPPPPIRLYHVPLSVVRFESLQTSAWDLTVQRILPHINGVNSVARIAQITDTDQRLARRAIQHLVYYDCVLLLDIFSFSAIYAPTPTLTDFIASTSMQDECRAYVYSPRSPFGQTTDILRVLQSNISSAENDDDSRPQSQHKQKRYSLASAHPDDHSKRRSFNSHDAPPSGPAQIEPGPPSRMQLIDLYSSMRQGLSLKDYCLHRSQQLRHIDVRRLVTFGVIKGFLYRVHKYALHTNGSMAGGAPIAATGTGPKTKQSGGLEEAHKSHPGHEGADDEAGWRQAALSSGWRLPNRRSTALTTGGAATPVTTATDAPGAPGLHRAEKKAKKGLAAGSVANGGAGTDAGSSSIGTSAARRRADKEDREALRFADGLRCFDEICSELHKVESEALERIRTAARGGEIVIISK